jgi:hypothetical protein
LYSKAAKNYKRKKRKNITEKREKIDESEKMKKRKYGLGKSQAEKN